MKILWVTNAPIGKHCEITKTNNYSSGWITSTIEILKNIPKLEMCIVTSWPLKRKYVLKESNQEFVLLPGGYPIQYNYKKRNNHKEWKKLVSNFNPDIIHIHGTEFPLALTVMKACPNEKYIISIQGLCNIIERYYYAGIDISKIIKTITIRDIIRLDTMFHARKKFQYRGILEENYLKLTKHVIGRTTWDYVHTKAINPDLTYHYCNESLRSEFYNKKWNIKKIKRHTIFISQAYYPIKGLHILLKALNILKLEYNDILVYIAGIDITKSDNLVEKIKISGYARYLRNLIKEYSLQQNISFTGNINAEKMALYYRQSHVFVCPSSIENSPNSLGEAQLIGIPCVASYVGGIPDMLKDNETGLLYRFEEFEMLANNIKRIFNDDDFAQKLSKEGKILATNRHNPKKNTEELISIYKKIIDSI